MTFCFQDISGRTFDIKRTNGMRGVDAKKHISSQLKIPPEKIDLLFKGKILKDNDYLNAINATEASPVIVHVYADCQPPFGEENAFDENEEKAPPKKEESKAEPQKVEPPKEDEPAKKEEPVKKEEPAKKIEQDVSYNDPDNFDEMIGNLLDMGFEFDTSARALRNNNYNQEDAVNALLSGTVDVKKPSKLPEIKPQNIVSQPSSNSRYDGINKNRGKGKNKGRGKNKRGGGNGNQNARYENKFAPFFPDNNEDTSKYDDILVDVKPGDKAELIRLSKNGCDMETLVTIYNDCEKSITALKSMLG